MRVTLKSLFLSLTTFAVLPAWHSCFGQDSTIAVEAAKSSQQPQQDGSQKPAAMSPDTNPSSQQTTPPPSTTAPPSSLDDTVDAGEMDDDLGHAPRRMAGWNEYRGPYITARAGMGFLVETASFAQDDVSKEQIKMLPAQRLRDFRFVLGGSFPSLSRKVT